MTKSWKIASRIQTYTGTFIIFVTLFYSTHSNPHEQTSTSLRTNSKIATHSEISRLGEETDLKCLKYSETNPKSCILCEDGALLSPRRGLNTSPLHISSMQTDVLDDVELYCKPCPVECRRCQSNSCSSCKQGFYKVPINYKQQGVQVYDCSTCFETCQTCNMESRKCTSCKVGFQLDQNICKRNTKVRDMVHLALIIFAGLVLIFLIIIFTVRCKKKKTEENIQNVDNSLLSTNKKVIYSDSLDDQAVETLAWNMKATKQFKIQQDYDPETLKNTENILGRDEDMQFDHYKGDVATIGLDNTKNSFYSDIINIDSVMNDSRESGFLGSMTRESHQISQDLLDSIGTEYQQLQ